MRLATPFDDGLANVCVERRRQVVAAVYLPRKH